MVVDLIQGQYKSTCRCLKCNNVSTAFDPFMVIPLPIPKYINCFFFYLPYNVSTKIYKYETTMKFTDTIMDLKSRIAKFASEDYNRFISPYDFVLA